MTDTVALWLTDRLVGASIQGAGVIALVWLVCRSRSGVPASVRAALWWLATLKLLLALLPVPSISIPVLPAALDWRDTQPVSAMTHEPAAVATTPAGVMPARVVTPSPAVVADTGGARWLDALILLWLGIVVLQAARLLSAFRQLRGVVRRSVPDADESGAVARLADLIGLARAPQVRMSEEVDAPQVAGLWRPVVLVPADAAALTAEERAMTLCHELMHIHRRDLVLGWVPALAERLFFFHPLARLAAREYLTSRESACDAAVVRTLRVSPADYGRMLVRLGVGGSTPALTAGGSSPSLSSLKRRLEMLQHAASSDMSRRSTWLIAIVGCALIPLQLVAGTPASPQSTPEAPSAAPRVVVPAVPVVPSEAPRPVIRVVQPPVERPVRVMPVEVVERSANDARIKMLELMALQGQSRATPDVPLQQLRSQLELLKQQLQQIAEHQEQLAAAQQALSNQAESLRQLSDDIERLRKTLDAR